MDELIKALQIFQKYIPNEKYPTWCGHDALHINCPPELISPEDLKILNDYGFIVDDEEYEGFISFRFGSC